MTHERRQAERCPTCKGPTKMNEKQQLICRNSLCAFNHDGIRCPRCGEYSVEPTGYEGQSFLYKCSDCLNNWKAK